MDLWQALILGLIEGLTEYLPVSSTGHLLVAQTALNLSGDEAANAYAIAIQAGAILAVLGLYRGRVKQIVAGLAGADPIGRRLALSVATAFMPAAILGLAFDSRIEQHLFGPWPVVAAWAVGGLVILLLGRRFTQREGARIEDVSLSIALGIGLAQCFALWPGVSRSLATILGGLACGLSLGAAVEFSFLLGLVTLGAATAYKALQSGAVMFAAYGPGPLIVGFVTAWASAVVSVRWMVSWLSRRGLTLFGWWRIAAAIGVGLWLHSRGMQ